MIKILWIILIIICFGQIIQSLLVLFATTEYFDVNSENLPYVSQWRLINYSIDIISWAMLILFYICIYIKSITNFERIHLKLVLFSKDLNLIKKKKKKKRKPSFVEESESRSGRFEHIKGRDDNDARSPKKRWRRKSSRKKKKKGHMHIDRAGSDSGNRLDQPRQPAFNPYFNPTDHRASYL